MSFERFATAFTEMAHFRPPFWFLVILLGDDLLPRTLFWTLVVFLFFWFRNKQFEAGMK